MEAVGRVSHVFWQGISSPEYSFLMFCTGNFKKLIICLDAISVDFTTIYCIDK